MESSFDFLQKDFPVLAQFGRAAETYLYSDSNSCLMKLGMIGETIINLIFTTVDLLTTGIDVPEVTTLVFMRRIKSRILFEQMLGRATRLCPRIRKTHFEIYDPVSDRTLEHFVSMTGGQDPAEENAVELLKFR